MIDMPAPRIERLLTGVPGLDTTLQGGFLQGGIYILMGAPGAGKTLLANQIAFHHAAQGAQILYVTLLAETHDRMIAHLGNMTFFNLGLVSRNIHYISGYAILEEEGLRGLWTMLRKEILAREATILVLDGLIMIESNNPGDLSFKRFLHELQVYNQMSGCTTFLLTQLDSTLAAYPGHTMADGLLGMTKQHVGPQAVRELEVHKLRGAIFLEGSHRYKISDKGLVVFPRIETLYRPGPELEPIPYAEQRLHFNIPRLDEMLHGGVLPASTTMLLGVPGSGKTLLGLHFLAAGAVREERGLYFGFYEQPSRLIVKANQVGLDFGGHVKTGMIDLIWNAPLEAIPDALAAQLVDHVRAHGIKRVFLDGLDGLSTAEIYHDRVPRFMTALSNQLRSMGITTLFSVELEDLFSPTISNPVRGVSAAVDNILFLRSVELRSHLYRLISILKMRESDYEATIREFKITAAGIDVAPTFASAESILTGIARVHTQ